MGWTAPRTWVTGELITASIMNTHIRDNLEALDEVKLFQSIGPTTLTTAMATVAGVNMSLDTVGKWLLLGNVLYTLGTDAAGTVGEAQFYNVSDAVAIGAMRQVVLPTAVDTLTAVSLSMSHVVTLAATKTISIQVRKISGAGNATCDTNLVGKWVSA